MRIATVGAALSGNKGAASMIEALVRHFEGDATIVLLTTYPVEDSELASPGVEVVALGPKQLVGVELPLALLARVTPRRWRSHVTNRAPALRALTDVDVVADISGVSFVDHRGWKFHAYNSLLAALPLLAGVPIVKCSQALGPFDQRMNRVLAKRLLPRMRRILARGEQSYDYVADLGIANLALERAADLAFTLPHGQPLEGSLAERLDALAGNGIAMFMPSAVVEGWCEQHGIDHDSVFADIIGQVCDRLGVAAVLVPHSFRASGKPRRMDDARVCRSVAAQLHGRADVVVIDEDLSPVQLRSLVDRADLLVASRFHGMVTGLAAGTPTVVLGWSHKYAEVLAQFDSAEFAFDYATLNDQGRIVEAIERAWQMREAISDRLATALPPVVASAHNNFAALRAVAGS